jgi:hypothetical protein
MGDGRRLAVTAAAAALAIGALTGPGQLAPPAAGREPEQAAGPARVTAGSISVFPGHPRLILGGWRGVTADDLARACASPEMGGECQKIGGQHALDDAMRYVLSGDGAAAARVRGTLLAGLDCGDSYEQTPAGGYALAFDWLWPALSADDRRQVEGELAACGTAIVTSLRGNSPHLWHGFTSQAAALALVALALDDHPDRGTLQADAAELFRMQALQAYAVTGGAWPEGYSYLRTHFFSGDPPYQYVMDALRAWDSAVEQDSPDHASVFDTIAAEEGDWLRGLAYHVVYGTLAPATDGGKPTLLRGGDMPTGQMYPNRQVRPYVDSIARVTGDPVLKRWGQSLESYWPLVAGDGTYHPIHRYSLPYNLPIDVPDDATAEPSLGRIWGREDLGYVITRSSWGPGETVVTYGAGKWFTGHQHMDQGSFDVWHRGPLVVDSGVYANWGTEHREAYYMRTVAHNTLLVHREGETFEQHPALAVAVNDDGQRVQTYNRRGCAQCIQSVDEWRANVGAGLHFEAGRIDAFEEGAGFTAVESDLTAGYNSLNYATPGNDPKVASVQRDLVFIRPRLLLVLDRVQTLAGTDLPRFTLHFPTRPEVAAALDVQQGSADNGILWGRSSGLTFTLANGAGGRLVGQTVVPEEAEATLIGGPDYRYWVDGANRAAGSQGLEGPPADPGAWRLEVAPAGRGNDDGPTDTLLVHALWVGDADSPAARVRRLATAWDPAAPGHALALVAPDAVPSELATDVLVVASGGVPRGTVRYAKVTGGAPRPALLVMLDAVPGARYAVAVGDQSRLMAAASAEGVLSAVVPLTTGLVVAACPAPADAGAAWQQACLGGPVPNPSLAYLPVATRR